MKKEWGLSIFLALATFGTIKVLLESPLSEHYRIFTTASRMLWNKANPYGFDFHSVGFWFYSPSCGMFFYSLFAYLPPMIGLLLYSLLSIKLFLYASKKMTDWSGLKTNIQWYYFFSSIAIYQALIAAKIETIMVSIVMICIPIIFETDKNKKPRNLLASFLLGMILVWKFQPLPIIGLLAVILLFRLKRIQLIALLPISILFWYFLPAIWLGLDTFLQFLRDQNDSINMVMHRDLFLFDHFYKFLNAIHISLTVSQHLSISVLFGLLSFLRVAYALLKKEPLIELVTLAAALGSIFIIAFSPLSQNNGSIFWVPTLLYGLLQTQKIETPPVLRKFIFFTFFVFAFAYSDLIPESLRIWLRSYSIKSVLLVALGLIWIFKPMKPKLEIPSHSSHS